MNDCYSPHTGEHIRTAAPADWMGRAGTPAPDYDNSTQSAFWQPSAEAWKIVTAAPLSNPVPQVISRRQAKQALLQAGLLDVADAAIAASADRAAQIDWTDAQEFHRDWATLISMQHALGLTDEQIDDLFRLAATL